MTDAWCLRDTTVSIFESFDIRPFANCLIGVQGQGAGPRLTDKDDDEEHFDAMGEFSKISIFLGF